MGPIQASLNQLTLSVIGAAGGLAHGIKGTFAKPQAPKAQPQTQPKAETTSGMGNIAKVGRDKSRTNLRAYGAAARAVDSANDSILQKATARFSPEDRLAQLKAASSLTTQGKGGNE